MMLDLCGGAFFTLVLKCCYKKRKNGKNDHSDKFKEQDILFELLSVLKKIDEVPNEGSLKTNASRYKSCCIDDFSPFYIKSEETIAALNETIKNDYSLIKNRMDDFVKKYINLKNTDVISNSVYHLLALIKNSTVICSSDLFYVLPDGNSISKEDLLKRDKLELSAFLLGVLHHIVSQRLKNKYERKEYKEFESEINKKSENEFYRIEIELPENSPLLTPNEHIRKYLKEAIDYYSKVKMLYYSEDPPYDFEKIVEPLDVTQNFVAYSRFQDKVERIKLTPEKIKEISPHLLIKGGGGSGKSWLIKHLFFQYAKEFDTSLIVPYLISLENYKQCVTVERLIYESVRLFKLSQDIIRKNIENEKVVLLLDGYDEIAIDSKQSFDVELSAFIQKYPGIRIIMTSRPIELLGIDSSFKYLYILPLTKDQQCSIVSKLFCIKKMDPWVANLILRYRYKDDLLKTPLFLSYWYNEWKKREKYLINYLQFLSPKSEQFGQVDREICSKIYSCSIYHAKNIYAIYEALATKSYKRQSVRNLGYTNISAKQMFSVIIKFVAIAYKDHVMAFDNCSVDKYLNNALEDESQELRDIPREYYIQDLTDNLSILSYTDGMYYYTSPKIIRFCVARFLQLLNDDDFIRWFKDLNLYQVDDSEINDLFEMLYELDPNKIEKNIFCHFIKNRMIPDGLLDGTNSKGYWLLMIRKYNYFRFYYHKKTNWNLRANCIKGIEYDRQYLDFIFLNKIWEKVNPPSEYNSSLTELNARYVIDFLGPKYMDEPPVTIHPATGTNSIPPKNPLRLQCIPVECLACSKISLWEDSKTNKIQWNNDLFSLKEILLYFKEFLQKNNQSERWLFQDIDEITDFMQFIKDKNREELKLDKCDNIMIEQIERVLNQNSEHFVLEIHVDALLCNEVYTHVRKFMENEHFPHMREYKKFISCYEDWISKYF